MRSWRDRREEGMMTVEAVLSLVPFIIVILGIISFTNIFVVHNKIQYALQQMGNELSCYTYFYQALGLRGADQALGHDMDVYTEDLDTTIGQFNDFLSQISTFEESLGTFSNSSLADVGTNANNVATQGRETVLKGKTLGSSVMDLVSDPKALLRGVIYLILEKGESAGKTLLLQQIAKGMMGIYLDAGFADHQALSADEYLRYFGVKDGIDGLDFSQSEFLDKNSGYRMIDVVLEYDLEIYLFKLFFKDPTIHVVQRCAVPAWLDGDGVTYTE